MHLNCVYQQLNPLNLGKSLTKLRNASLKS